MNTSQTKTRHLSGNPRGMRGIASIPSLKGLTPIQYHWMQGPCGVVDHDERFDEASSLSNDSCWAASISLPLSGRPSCLPTFNLPTLPIVGQTRAGLLILTG